MNRFKKFMNNMGSTDGISPLLTTPDYGSDWSYSYHINNNIPFTKRRRFKKKRKKDFVSQNNKLEKKAFTPPSGSHPSFTDIKTPTSQLISILSGNFNKTEKFMEKQEEYNKKIAKAIDDLEKEIKELKKKLKN